MKQRILKGDSKSINPQRHSALNKQDFRFHIGIKIKMSPTILPARHKAINKTYSAIFNEQGYSLIEIIVIVAVLAGLTSIATTAIQNTALEFENDEIQAHLNSVGNECLGAMGRAISTEEYDDHSLNPKEKQGTDNGINAINEALLSKNGYAINSSHTHCPYFQIDPIDSDSTTKPSIGFGIFNGKLTKFGVHADDDSDARDACERWAGDKCVDSTTDSYDKFFKYMHDVQYKRDKCELDFRKGIAGYTGSGKNRWDVAKSSKCNNENEPKPNTDNSYKTSTCNNNGCDKKAYVYNGKFTGYTETSFTEAEELECSNSINKHFDKDSYKGDAEVVPKEELTGCKEDKYICDYSEHSEASYEACKVRVEIEPAVSKCKLDLEKIRKAGNIKGTVVGASEDLEGLPPCGQKVWICDKVIYETEDSYKVVGGCS